MALERTLEFFAAISSENRIQKIVISLKNFIVDKVII
jgi:hypothetical protein